MDYREAGVDISAADEAKDRIKKLARGTYNAGVLSEIGSFGGMFRPDLSGLREPVLVSSTDSVGTKTKVAILAGVHDTVGHDIVNHCVNDILVQGAVPLFFLDYLAVGKIDVDKVEAIVRGVASACSEVGCPLVGGETAQMPDVYAPDDYDLAGFIVGIVDRDRALTGAAVREGDALLGLPSSGLHTNGYTLARKVLFDVMGLRVDTALSELGTHRRRARSSRPTGRTSPRSSRSSSGARSAPSPTSRAAASPETFLASCPTASARACARARGRCRRSSASSRRADPSTRTRCTGRSTWGSGWWSWSRPTTSTTWSTARAPRRDELRDRIRGEGPWRRPRVA